jgi:hypothetical protein
MKINKIYIFISTIVILIVLVYRSNFLMFKVINALDDKTKGILHLGDMRNSVMKVVDDINPLKGVLWNNSYDIPEVNITFKKKDFEKIDDTIANAKKSSPYAFYMPNEVNDFIKSKITIGGEKYNCKIKLHGTNNPHFKTAKRSYSVKISKKNKDFPFEMRRFALIIPSQSNLIGLFTYKISKMLGMLSPKNFLVRVHLNGIDQGIYHLEEKLNKTLLERNGMSGYDVVRSDDSWAHQYSDNHGTFFSFDYSGIQPKYISGKNLNQMVIFKNLLNSKDIDYIKQHIDIDEFINYDVLRYIFGDSAHMTSNDNVKFIYNTSNGRLEPYFRIENHIYKILRNKLSYSPEQHVNIGKYTASNLFMMLTKDDEYRERRNKAIYNILQQKNKILRIFDDLMNNELDVLLNDTTNKLPSRYFKYEMEEARKYLVHNFKFLEKYLRYSRVFVETVKKDINKYQIEIKPDSNAPIRVSEFAYIVDKKYTNEEIVVYDVQQDKTFKTKILSQGENMSIINLSKILKNSTYTLSLDDNLEAKKNSYKYVLKFDGRLLENRLKFKNDLNNINILPRDVYSVIVDETKVDENNSFINLDDFILINKDLGLTRLNKNTLLLKSGIYTIKQNIIFPFDTNLIIEKGTIIKMKEKTNLLVYGNMTFKGTEYEPIKIINNDKNKVFGTISAIGDGTTKCEINYLEIYGGNEAFVNGVHLSGALSLYNHNNVKINNSYIHHNSSDDGLNIKNANILLQNNVFNANMADQVDLDFCTGTVKDNKFIEKSIIKDFVKVIIPSDDNGDGLDFSGSEIVVENNEFMGFLDKGISIGENTLALIYKNNFLNNRSAITAKDQSKVYLYDNYYENNKIYIEMYQKKKMFKHPLVFNINEKHSGDKIKKTIESHYYKLDETQNIDMNSTNIFDELKNKDWVEYE